MDSFRDTVDADDNAFYQQLTRQILMITDEDDDDKGVYTNRVVELGRRPVVYGGVGSVGPVARNYYSWLETERSSVPSWMESLWAHGGGGTGVFIPSGGATTGRHGKRSGRRRYGNNKATKNSNRGRLYSAATGQKIHG